MHIKSFGVLGLRTIHLNEIMKTTSLSASSVKQLAASKVNIFVGPNGGGKSTILDMVRALKDINIITTIARENMRSTTASTSIVHFEDGSWIATILNKRGIDEFGTYIQLNTKTEKLIFEGSLYNKSSNPPKKLMKLIEKIEINVYFRSSHDERGVPTEKIIDALNNNGKYLVGLAPYPLHPNQKNYQSPPSDADNYKRSKPINHIKKDLLGIYLNDDLGQYNHVSMKMLPSGWRAFAGLLGWLECVEDNQVCVIEEPEVHLHPTLQRLLVAKISEIANRKNLQLFISTHSSILLDISIWPIPNVKLFGTNGHDLYELTSPAVALAGLGIKPSDVFQANGVIWVEGASDRIYLLHWLSLWCSAHNKVMPIENLDFSFVFYGGSMLGHFTSNSTPGLIDIFSINRNSIIIMDRDLDFERLPNGDDICTNKNCVKYKVWENMSETDSRPGYCWITEGYTIESYLQPDFRARHYKTVDSRLSKTSNKSKVAIATQFTLEASAFDTSFDTQSDLPIQIEKLFQTINKWKL